MATDTVLIIKYSIMYYNPYKFTQFYSFFMYYPLTAPLDTEKPSDKNAGRLDLPGAGNEIRRLFYKFICFILSID